MLSIKLLDNVVIRAVLSNVRELIQSNVEAIEAHSGGAAVVYKIVLLLAQVEQVSADVDYMKVHAVDTVLHDTAMDIWKLLSTLSQRTATGMSDALVPALARFKSDECSLSNLLEQLDLPDAFRCDDQWPSMRLEVLNLVPFFSIARALRAVQMRSLLLNSPYQEEEQLHELTMIKRLPFDRLLRLSASKTSTTTAGLQIFFRRLSLVSSFVIKWLKVGGCFKDTKAQIPLNTFVLLFVQSLVEVLIAIPSIHKSSELVPTISSQLSVSMSHIVRHVGSLLSVCYGTLNDKAKETSMILIMSMQSALVDEMMRTQSVWADSDCTEGTAILHAILDTMNSLDSICLLISMKCHVLEYIQSQPLMQSFFRFVLTYIPHAQHMAALIASKCRGDHLQVLRNMEQHNSKLLLIAARSSVKHLFSTSAHIDLLCADSSLLEAFSASPDNVHSKRFRSLFCMHLMTSLSALLLNCSGDGSCRDRVRDRVSMVIRKLYRIGDAVEHPMTSCNDPALYDWLLMELHAKVLLDFHCNDEKAASTEAMVMEHLLTTILANLISTACDHGMADTDSSEVEDSCQRLLLFRAAVLSSMWSNHVQHLHIDRVIDSTLQVHSLHLTCRIIFSSY